MAVLAQARLELGALEEAARLLRQGVACARAGHERLPLVDLLRVQAMLATRQEQWSEAETALEEALSLCRSMPCPYAEAKALYVYGLLHTAKGEPEPARARLKAALAICGWLGERLYAERIEEALARLNGP